MTPAIRRAVLNAHPRASNATVPLAAKLLKLPACLHAAACTNALQLQRGLQCLQLVVHAGLDERMLRRIAEVLPDVAGLQALALDVSSISLSQAEEHMLRAAAQIVRMAQQLDSRIVIAHLALPQYGPERAEYLALVDVCAPILLSTSTSAPFILKLRHERRDTLFPLLERATQVDISFDVSPWDISFGVSPWDARDVWQHSRHCPSLAQITLTVGTRRGLSQTDVREELRATCAHLASWSALQCLHIRHSFRDDDYGAMVGVMGAVAQLTALTGLHLALSRSHLREAMPQLSMGTPLRSQNGNFANTWTQAAGTLRAASGMQTEAI